MIMGDKKKVLTAILGEHKEIKEPEVNALETIAGELIECIHAHDVAGVVEAFKALFAECEMSPHEEGPHIE